jgi:hypothetical protein
VSRTIAGVTRRTFISTVASAALTLPARARAQAVPREILYNGIVLPAPWPPMRRELTAEPHPPPYLLSPPGTINIDLGRQLFVDDFLIGESSLYRQFHAATYHAGNPILAPEREWERQDPHSKLTGNPANHAAMPFSDGVFYDPDDRIFKMWYMAGYQHHTALALSTDGMNWDRPSLGIVRGTNIVSTMPRDSNTVWLDLDAPPATRFKMAAYEMKASALRLFTSADGIRWSPQGVSGRCGDRSTVFKNAFRNVWVYSLRDDGNGMQRFRRYFETRDFPAARWPDGGPVAWVGADRADHTRPEMPTIHRELYTLDAVAYESVLLGLFTVFRGERPDREKPNDLCVAFSRDGFHWSRDFRDPFIPVSEQRGDWNWANVQSAGGVCTVVGDRLHFYVSGRQGVPGTQLPGTCSTGLATLRRDGFASVTDTWPQGAARQTGLRPGLTTRPLHFSGGHLFVNADVTGELRVEVLDRSGHAIEAFSAQRCVPVRGDSTHAAVTWTGGANLSTLAGQPVRFRFLLSNARLFAFWVSRSTRGESTGYMGAGGPAFPSGRDGH